ncbi:MAG: hypothetical protein ABI663_16515 [Chryseolinea sp.]
MKQLKLFTLALLTISLPAYFWSCSSDEATPPAPQVTSDKPTLNLVPYQDDVATLTIVAPATFESITAVADNGVVTVSDITGTGTKTATAKLNYTAPDITGNFKITVTITDKANQITTEDVNVAVTAKAPVTLGAGNITLAKLEKGTTYIAAGGLVIPEGSTLTIEEDVTVIFDGDGTATAPELTVKGKLYSYGTAQKPVKFTIPVAKRIKANIFAGLWGGIQATDKATEVVLLYTHIEYAGAPAGPGNPSVDNGMYEDGAARYGLLITNPEGKFVMQHSRIAYTSDDGMRVVGGTVLITNNIYELNGRTGGESVNIKSGVKGTVAYNFAYRSATNAYKWSNASGFAATPQTDVDAYNNTAVECGWRQTKSGRGGSLNIEKAGRGQCYNNLSVNCRFGVRVVSDADIDNLTLGYSLYFGTEQVMVDEFYPTAGAIVKGDKETNMDVVGLVGEKDPKFEAYTLTGFVSADVKDPAVLDFMPASVDFHVKSDSPALAKGKTGLTLKPAIVIDGKTYSAPVASNFIGAFGTK